MFFLLTNDDGIQAPGLKALAYALKRVGEVAIVAPERERSAIGHGITMHKPLRVTEVRWEEPVDLCVAVNGTPADCVKLALEALLEKRPEFVISGINRGENLGTDVLYSGTVSGAIEGCIGGIPSLAVSLISEDPEDFPAAARITAAICLQLTSISFPVDTFLNINIPAAALKNSPRVAFTRLGRRRYINAIDRRLDPRGRAYYWLGGQVEDLDQAPDTDIGAVAREMISITPLQLDLTNFQFLSELQQHHLSGLNLSQEKTAK
ncbi:MAG: 5/3-nucleotidase [Clostridia bacterium]|nr:5/3-nucleotidase [Clostridia bacterium]